MLGIVVIVRRHPVLVEIRRRLELEVAAGQFPWFAASLATDLLSCSRHPPTRSMAVVVVAGMMMLAAEFVAWLQLVAAPPPRSLLAAAQVIQVQEQPVAHC